MCLLSLYITFLSMKKSLIVTSILLLILFSIGVYNYRDRLFKSNESGKDCTPYNMLVDKEVGRFVISWETVSQCSGIVKFGSSVEALNYWLNAERVNGKNSVVLDRDVYKNVRYFIIISNGEAYGMKGKAIAIE